jgi:hypothetical protein
MRRSGGSAWWGTVASSPEGGLAAAPVSSGSYREGRER